MTLNVLTEVSLPGVIMQNKTLKLQYISQVKKIQNCSYRIYPQSSELIVVIHTHSLETFTAWMFPSWQCLNLLPVPQSLTSNFHGGPVIFDLIYTQDQQYFLITNLPVGLFVILQCYLSHDSNTCWEGLPTFIFRSTVFLNYWFPAQGWFWYLTEHWRVIHWVMIR